MSTRLLEDIEHDSYDTYKDIESLWTQIPEHHFLHPHNAAVPERSALPDLSYKYINIYYRKKIVAHMYLQILDVRPYHFKFESSNWQTVASAAMRSLRPKLLICGHLFRHEISTVYFQDTSFTHYQQAQIIYDIACKVLKTCGISALLLKDLPSQYNNYLLHHADKCKPMTEDISMELELCEHWQNFEDYESALKHKYKQRTRKIRKAATSLTTRALSTADLSQYSSQIEQYYNQLLSKQLVKLGYINMEYIRELMTQDSGFELQGIFDEQESLIGFFSFFDKKDRLYMYYVGYNAEVNRQYSLYFNILYWGVETAIQRQKEYLHMGRTALDAKASIGCAPIYSQNFYRIKSALLNRISQRGQSKFMAAQGEVWDMRRPFNTEYYEMSKNNSLA